MPKGNSLYNALEKELSAINSLYKYLHILEKDIIGTYSILFPSSKKKDPLYEKARDYFVFAVIPSIEIIKDEELKKKHERYLMQAQTLLALNERFANNLVDGHSKYIQNELTFYIYTFYEAICLLSNELKSIIGISTNEVLRKIREIPQLAYHKIPYKNKLSTHKINILESANHLWKRAGSIFILPSLLGTTPQGLKALEKYISANILLDDLLDLYEDYKHDRETLPLLLWKTYSQEMTFNKWASDFVTKETLNIIIKLLDESNKLFDKDGLKYSSQMAKILKGKYCEWFPEHL